MAITVDVQKAALLPRSKRAKNKAAAKLTKEKRDAEALVAATKTIAILQKAIKEALVILETLGSKSNCGPCPIHGPRPRKTKFKKKYHHHSVNYYPSWDSYNRNPYYDGPYQSYSHAPYQYRHRQHPSYGPFPAFIN